MTERTDSEALPREWAIRNHLYVYDRPNSPPGNQVVTTVDGPDTGLEMVFVIEKAAFDQLAQQLASANRGLESRDKEIQALRSVISEYTCLDNIHEPSCFTQWHVANRLRDEREME